jgi:hypothetical protein
MEAIGYCGCRRKDLTMNKTIWSCLLVLLLIVQLHGNAVACGPTFIQPIFIFEQSPDLPFKEFVAGNIGILRPTFGRKTLFIAYHYLNGGAFTSDEEQALIEALRGKAPEDEGNDTIKAWIAARKQILGKDGTLPDIYAERRYVGGYDFFPNCAKNAFEVATATLKDRIASYGPDDQNVHTWLAAQDLVFQNCQAGAAIPVELGAESPTWLRKDRDYQIAAALLYSLNFNEARARFEKIAADIESAWQETAEYLVGRTLVRQASLAADANKKPYLYEQAERQLRMIGSRHSRFSIAARKLLALIQFRSQPNERVRELAGILMNEGGNQNLKQDLIDYVWLLDKIEDRILKDGAKRNRTARGEKDEDPEQPTFNKEARERYEAVQRGEMIEISWSPKQEDGRPDYMRYISLYFKPAVTTNEMHLAFEEKLGRSLTPDELKELDERYTAALKSRQYLLSPNRKYSREGLTEHEGCDYQCDRLTLDLMPAVLRADDLSDWIFTVQTADANAYPHALAKWRETESPAWFAVAITKADITSPRIERLINFAEKLDRESPAYATAAYNLVRLNIASGKLAEARKILDSTILPVSERLPLSARNQFLEQRIQLAADADEFLKFAQQKPTAFYDDGALGSIRDLASASKARWDLYHRFADNLVNNQPEESKDEYEQRIDESYKDLLPWDDRFQFDTPTVDILNWHFPLEQLELAARNPIIPDYLRRRLMLAVWTRAIVLHNETIASRIAPEIMKLAPEMKPVFESYLQAWTATDKEHAALFVLLEFPGLTPFVAGGIPEFPTAEESEYYFETSWWCTPTNTEYDVKQAREVSKVVPKPRFLTTPELERARREREALIAIGDGKSYLGKRVLKWAKESPNDPLTRSSIHCGQSERKLQVWL